MNEICGFIFCVLFLSLSISLGFIHVMTCASYGMNNIPFYEYTSFCLSVHQLMGMWAVFTFCLVLVILL